jgi:hypothetical protein
MGVQVAFCKIGVKKGFGAQYDLVTCTVKNYRIRIPKIAEMDSLSFSFDFKSESWHPSKIGRLDFAF